MFENKPFKLYRPDPEKRRYYVMDVQGNRLYYGSRETCQRFIKFMMKGDKENGKVGKG